MVALRATGETSTTDRTESELSTASAMATYSNRPTSLDATISMAPVSTLHSAQRRAPNPGFAAHSNAACQSTTRPKRQVDLSRQL